MFHQFASGPLRSRESLGPIMRRDYRLRRSADFERVRANRSSWAHPLLVCSRRKRDDSDPARVGIIVGRRVGKAATRNRVKRRIRELARTLYAGLQPGNDIVFIVRPAAAAASFADLASAVASLLGRAHALRPPEPRERLAPGSSEL